MRSHVTGRTSLFGCLLLFTFVRVHKFTSEPPTTNGKSIPANGDQLHHYSGATKTIHEGPTLRDNRQQDEAWDPDVATVYGGCRRSPGDPDTVRNVRQIIESRGYIAHEYSVVTDDGYILAVQRILNPLISLTHRAGASSLRPVILQHGLMSSASDWVINSVDIRPMVSVASTRTGGGVENLPPATWDSQEQPNSLAFYLANRGYDVYLANSRGNIYCRRHVNMSSHEGRFWDFTFDEKIAHDLPATIEFVRRLTGRPKVAYVGHSQGSAMMFGLMSLRPEYADIVEPFVALAPVAYVSNALTPLRRLDFLTPYMEHKNGPFITNRQTIDFLASLVCSWEVVWRDLCKNFIFLIVGFNEQELDPSRIPALLCHTPSGTSFKNMAHYGQEIRSGRFAQFDHGLWGNLRKYGRPEAPDYALAAIRSRSIILFTAENDWLASPPDVAHLLRELRVRPHALVNVSQLAPKWNHADFLYGKHAGQLINPRVYEFLAQFDGGGHG